MRPRPAMTVLAAALLPCFSGCASGSRHAASEFEGTQPVPLTQAQRAVVESGVRRMVGNAGAALKAVTAVRVDNMPGIQVCGHVAANGAAAGAPPELPFYVELSEADGKPVARRGQVGTDPSKVSKVRFMCRRNG